MRNEVSSVIKKMMEEKKGIECGKNKEEIGKEMMKNIGMMKFIVCYCVGTEWNYTSYEEQEKMYKEMIIPICESMFGEREEGIVPSDALNGDGILLKILYWAMCRSECRRLLCCSEKKELFGRIVRLSMDSLFNRTREKVFVLLMALASSGESDEVEWMRKEGGIRCGLEGMKKTNERVNDVEYCICSFHSKFCEKELKERRKENEKEEHVDKNNKEQQIEPYSLLSSSAVCLLIQSLHNISTHNKYLSCAGTNIPRQMMKKMNNNISSSFFFHLPHSFSHLLSLSF
jgi:hypothetical protein